MDMFISNRSRRDITNFCWKHRGKIAVASLGIGAVLGAAYYYYDDGDNETETENGLEDDEKEDGSSEAGKEESTPAGRGTDPVARGTDPAAIQKRTNEIIAVNDLFDFSLVYFLPTIRQKVKEEVDVTETIQKLKSLMNRETAPDQHVTKSALWREIQLSAFNTLLTTAYAVSTASLLLMVQMHLLVRHRSNSTSSSSTSSDDHSGVFRELMERTFGSFFKSGICDLANRNKEIIGDVFNDVEWTVEKTLKVTHEDLREVLSMMKWRVENGIDGKSTIRELTKLLFRDNICVGAASGEKTTQKSVSFLPSVETPQTGGGQPLRVSAVMDETWKILKTPMFDVALQDITDSVFTFLLRTLWEDVFLPLRQSECDFPLNSTILHPGSPNSPAEMESPQTTPAKEQQQQQRNVTGEHKFTEASVPLAKLLPKLKAAAFKLIPDEISVNGTSDARGNEGSEHDDPFVRSTGVSAPGRSVSVQRIRSMCGADDARSSSFNLCSVLLDKRVA